MAATTLGVEWFARRRPVAFAAFDGATPRDAGRPRRILVVDDEPDIRETMPDVLHALLDLPVEVETVGSAEEARRRIESGRDYDLVITDERMPGLRGSEFLRWLETARPRTKRALMSAYVGREAADPATVFLQKPLDLDAVLPRLKELLR